jgi:hypothetical protein
MNLDDDNKYHFLEPKNSCVGVQWSTRTFRHIPIGSKPLTPAMGVVAASTDVNGLSEESTVSKSTSGDECSGQLMYFSSVSMALRNPMLICWFSYTEECLEFFAASSAILPSDAWLCHLVRNQHLAEDVAMLFPTDDPASIVSLSGPKIKFLLRSFEQ